MAEDKQQTNLVAEIFLKLLNQSIIFEDIKQTIKKMTSIAQKHTFHALTTSEQQYLHTYGLTYHQEEHFNFINHMLHQRTNVFLDKIAQSKVQVKSTIPPPPPPPPQIPSEIIQEVDQVLKNIDLPLSLFKRNDNYWSQNNPKTVQVKEYIKQLHDEDRKWKGELKKKRQDILNQKNQIYHKNHQQVSKQQLKIKEQDKIKKLKKIQFLKSQPQNRKRTIEQSIEFMKKQGRPLFKKMQEQFYNKIELPGLQQRKRKLSEVRQLRKSVDLIEIQQHRQKIEKIKEQHQPVKITDQPIKVSFKSEFHKSLQKSSIRYLSQSSRVKSLYDKRVQYAQIVKDNFKPTIDQEKASQIAERIQLMGKRYARAKKAFKNKPEQDEQDEDAEEEQQQPEPEPEPQEQEEQEEQDEDQLPKQKDDQYNPSNQERYKMGLKFLEQARKKRKKVQVNKSQTIQTQDIKNKTFSVKQAMNSQNIDSQHQTIGSAPTQNNRKIKYRNYLHEMSKTNKTIDFIDTSRIKNQFTQDMKLKKQIKQQEIESKLKTIQQRAKNEEELLKFKKVKKEQALVRKQEFDNAILDTIKARLALMKS